LSTFHLSHALNLYLHPQATKEYSPEHASFALSRHLNLEMFEPSLQPVYYEETPLFGKGAGNALVVTLDASDAVAVIPQEFEVSYTLGSRPEFDSVTYTLLSRAKHTYDSVYEGSGSLWKISQLNQLSSFLESEEYGFAAIELRELSRLRLDHGSTSAEYQDAVHQLRTFLSRAIADHDNLRVALVTTFDVYDSKRRVVARQEQSPLPPPQQPIGSISTCFADQGACQNGTNSCSGRGECVEATKSGHTCFVCLCSTTKTGEGANTKTEIWVGESCERKDISGPFVLLTGTVVVLIILVISSVSLLSGIGESELPSTLLSTVVTGKKD
jgi:hypothetical protein